MSGDLPEDVIIEIFSRLPLKSLLRFRTVSKSLRDCIGSPGFTRLYNLRCANKFMIIHRTRIKGESFNKLIYTTHAEDELSYNPYMRTTPVEYPFTSINIVGSCNGVLCVYEFGNGINLWNPSIRRKVTIPDLPSSSGRLIHGFGFDPIINDYKILRISRYSSFVYTVKTHTWREITSPTTRFPDGNSAQCLFNGALHWVIKLTDWFDACRERYIMKFDLSYEVFSMIKLPDPSWETNVVTIINGCLGVISSKYGKSKIWMMKEHHNTFAPYWFVAFKLTTDRFVGAKRVLQRVNDGHLVVHNSNGIGVCNPKFGRLMELQRMGCSSLMVGMNMWVESLELLDMGTSCDKGTKLSRKGRNIISEIMPI